jgi:hypothetical protein
MIDRQIASPSIDDLRVDAFSSIRHGNNDAARSLNCRCNTQNPGPLLVRHCIDRIGDQIYEHLLQLDPIPFRQRQMLIQLQLDGNAVPLQLALRERESVAHEVVEVE